MELWNNNKQGCISISPLLNPNWITGFIDAEGSFMVSIYREKIRKDLAASINKHWKVTPIFSIALHRKDISLLLEVKEFFKNTGNIYLNNSNNSFIYNVRDLNSIKNVVIPHFDKYPLLTQKYNDYLLFKEIINIIDSGKHLTLKGKMDIINLKKYMNKGLTLELKQNFPSISYEVSNINSPLSNLRLRELNPSIDFYWFAGFFSGDGCFYVNITKSKTCKIGFSVKLYITITQHLKDINLMEKIGKALKSGAVYKHSNNAVVLKLFTFNDINNIIIPLFKNYPIKGVRQKDFEDFTLIAQMMLNKEHLTKKGLNKIKQIKKGMNKGRLI